VHITPGGWVKPSPNAGVNQLKVPSSFWKFGGINDREIADFLDIPLKLVNRFD
jgi:hypothetical protein